MKAPFFLVVICGTLLLGCKPDPKPQDEPSDQSKTTEVRDSTVSAAIDSVMNSEQQELNKEPIDQTKSQTNNPSKKETNIQKTATNANNNEKPPSKPVVKANDLISDEAYLAFKELEYAFETVKEGEDIKYNFEFQNLGKKPLVISNASSPCSCTFAEFPLEPVMPGHSGSIKALFATKGFYGKQVKTINVVSNAENELVSLKINGLVEEVEAFAKEREEKSKQWQKDKKEMEKQQAEMKKALEEQKRKKALEDSIKQVQSEQATKDSLNRVKQALEDSLKSGN